MMQRKIKNSRAKLQIGPLLGIFAEHAEYELAEGRRPSFVPTVIWSDLTDRIRAGKNLVKDPA
jgi:hypothetical protein